MCVYLCAAVQGFDRMPLHLIDFYNFKPPADLIVNREESQAIRLNAAKTSLVRISCSRASQTSKVYRPQRQRACCSGAQHMGQATYGSPSSCAEQAWCSSRPGAAVSTVFEG